MRVNVVVARSTGVSPHFIADVTELERGANGERRFQITPDNTFFSYCNCIVAVADFGASSYRDETHDLKGDCNSVSFDSGRALAIRQFLIQRARNAHRMQMIKWELARACGQNDNQPFPAKPVRAW